MSARDGGQAFPVLHTIDGNWTREPLAEFLGMTLRDYFAAKAMQAIVSRENDERDNAQIAAVAYAIAGAMLAERSKL